MIRGTGFCFIRSDGAAGIRNAADGNTGEWKAIGRIGKRKEAGM
jgi:hypothetical protein